MTASAHFRQRLLDSAAARGALASHLAACPNCEEDGAFESLCPEGVKLESECLRALPPTVEEVLDVLEVVDSRCPCSAVIPPAGG